MTQAAGADPTPASAVGGADGLEREVGQIARGAGVGLAGNVVNYGVAYLFGILVARQIGATQFGLYTLAVTAVTLLTRFTIMGLDRGLMRYASISRGEGKGQTLRWLTLIALALGTVTGLVGALLLWLEPEFVLRLFGWSGKPELIPLLMAFAISVPAITLIGVAIAGTQAFRTMRYRALVVNTIQPVLRLIVALFLIPVLGPTAMAPVLAFVVAQGVGMVLALFFLGRLVRTVPPSSEHQAGLARGLVRFSAPLALSNVLDYMNGRTEIIVIGIFLAANSAGVYNAAVRLAGLGLIVLTAFNAIFSPLISDLHHRHEMVRLDRLNKLVTRWTMAFAMPIVLVQLVFAPQLMSLFGREFIPGATALRLLTLGQLVNFATGSVGVMLIMIGRSDIAFVNAVVNVAVALALDFWLVPRYGLMGAGIAGGLTLALPNLLRLGEIWVLLRIHPFSRPFLKPFIAAIPAAAAGLAWLRWLPLNSVLYLAAASSVMGLVYVAFTLLLRLDAADHMLLNALVARALRGRRSGRRLPTADG